MTTNKSTDRQTDRYYFTIEEDKGQNKVTVLGEKKIRNVLTVGTELTRSRRNPSL